MKTRRDIYNYVKKVYDTGSTAEVAESQFCMETMDSIMQKPRR